MIKADIVADSLAPSGVRLTTFVLTYPRFIHAEFMTHRVFSRNASSSRAIPVKKQIEEIKKNPAIPLAFRKNKKGMQAGEILENQEEVVNLWLEGRDRAVEIAEKLSDMEVHKQYANRVLEPYAHITVVCTATDFDNFFALRVHPAAQPEICALATLMWEAYALGVPEKMEEGDFHLPFIDDEDVCDTWDFAREQEGIVTTVDKFVKDILIKRSVAKCARVSYLNHDGTKTNIEQDLQLYDRLLGQVPIHASPAEHQAMAVADPNVKSGNFRGWVQYRKTLAHENIDKFNFPESFDENK